jgi:hypothetical protein
MMPKKIKLVGATLPENPGKSYTLDNIKAIDIVDGEILAMQTLTQLHRDLHPAAFQRVLNWVNARFGTERSQNV